MIHDGTISTGSGCTVRVPGAYWISSISRLRYTTLPGVTAMFSPTRNSSVPTGRHAACLRIASSHALAAPLHRLSPPVRSVSCSTSGLVARKFDGETMSSNWRVDEGRRRLRDAGHAAHAGGRVPPPLLGQQEPLIHDIERPLAPAGAREPPVLRQRLDAGRTVTGHRLRGIERQAGRLAPGLLRQLGLLAGRTREMREPVEVSRNDRGGGDARGQASDQGAQSRFLPLGIGEGKRIGPQRGEAVRLPPPLWRGFGFGLGDDLGNLHVGPLLIG